MILTDIQKRSLGNVYFFLLLIAAEYKETNISVPDTTPPSTKPTIDTSEVSTAQSEGQKEYSS